MKYLITSLFLLFIFSCQPAEEIVVPELNESYNIYRIDQEFFAFDSLQIPSEIIQFSEKYPAFASLYFGQILPLAHVKSDEELSFELKGFLSDKDIQWLYDTCQVVYPNLEELKNSLDYNFAYYKAYFPERDVPDIYTFISAFQFQRFIFQDEQNQDAIGLGLDLFLGSDFPYQQMVPNNPNFSDFLSWTFTKEFIPKKLMELLVDDLIGEVTGSRLLDYMIHHGKKWYILQKLMPKELFSRISELTDEQLEWCNKNEIELWGFLLSEDLFYETNFMKISKFIQPSPVAPPGMPSNAPGLTGNYLGWRIVQHFMKRNPDLSLEDLIALDDAQKILDQSKYKPRSQ